MICCFSFILKCYDYALNSPDMKCAPQILEYLFGSQDSLFSTQVHKCLLSASFGNLCSLIPCFLLALLLHPMVEQLNGILIPKTMLTTFTVLPYKNGGWIMHVNFYFTQGDHAFPLNSSIGVLIVQWV